MQGSVQECKLWTVLERTVWWNWDLLKSLAFCALERVRGSPISFPKILSIQDSVASDNAMMICPVSAPPPWPQLPQYLVYLDTRTNVTTDSRTYRWDKLSWLTCSTPCWRPSAVTWPVNVCWQRCCRTPWHLSGSYSLPDLHQSWPSDCRLAWWPPLAMRQWMFSSRPIDTVNNDIV